MRIENLDSASLDQLREEIDLIDREILEKIVERGKIAQQVGFLKDNTNDFTYKPEREKAIIRQLEEHLKSYLKELYPETADTLSKSIRYIYSEIISYCRSLERPPKVAFLGPPGSFSHLAAIRQFGRKSNLAPLKNFEVIFEEISKQQVDYGVIPIENSTDGMINQSIDLFQEYQVGICAEVFINIKLNLYSKAGSLSDVKNLYSHPQPFAQARKWLQSHLPQTTLHSTNSTSEAAEIILNEPTSGCIASSEINEIYPKLNLLAEGIEDHSDNTTRFVIIGKRSLQYKLKEQLSSDQITSVIITIKDRSGALYEILSELAKEKVNLTNLVSRPSRKKAFDYLFYIDFVGHPEEERIQRVLKSIQQYVVSCDIIGTYARGLHYH